MKFKIKNTERLTKRTRDNDGLVDGIQDTVDSGGGGTPPTPSGIPVGIVIRSLEDLDYPETDTDDGRVGIASDSGTHGGTVTVTGSETVFVNEQYLNSPESGVRRTVELEPVTSGELSTNQNYFVRLHVVDNVPEITFERGNGLGDTPPPDQLTTIAGQGGYDTTKYSVLLATVRTSGNGTTPIVLPLQNRKHLLHKHTEELISEWTKRESWTNEVYIKLDFARKPQVFSNRVGFSWTDAPVGSGYGFSGGHAGAIHHGVRAIKPSREGYYRQYVLHNNLGDTRKYSLLFEIDATA